MGKSITLGTFVCSSKAILYDGKTPNERLIGNPFDAKVIAFGAMVEYHLIFAEGPSKLHQFDPKVLSSIFPGCALHAGESGKEKVLVADIAELEEMDESEIHNRRLNALEIITLKRGEYVIFSIADGTVKLSGRDHGNRNSIQRRDQPVQENPSAVNQLMVQIQELQDKVNSLNDAKEFCDLETARSSGLSHVPSQPTSVPSPRRMMCRDSCLLPDTRNSLGTSEDVFVKFKRI